MVCRLNSRQYRYWSKLTPTHYTYHTSSSANRHAQWTVKSSRSVPLHPSLNLPSHSPLEPQDLSYLNRDLSKVVAIDTLPEHLKLQPENAVIIPKWKGEKDLRAGLVNLIPFLECTSPPPHLFTKC